MSEEEIESLIDELGLDWSVPVDDAIFLDILQRTNFDYESANLIAERIDEEIADSG